MADLDTRLDRNQLATDTARAHRETAADACHAGEAAWYEDEVDRLVAERAAMLGGG